jgi:EmrB/QacA subfamily drug resistance transporter
VVNAYVLTFAGFLLFGGRSADLFGRRRVFIFGLSLFTLASLAGGIAQDPAWLTTARAVQGVGGAFLSPATLTIVITTFPEATARARALGIWSAVAGAGGAAGSVLGGVLTAELSWRWVLFVNIPIGLVAIVAAAIYLTGGRRRAPEGAAARLDVAGALTITAGLGALVYAIVGTGTHAWASTYTLGFLGAAVVLLLAFAFIELRVAKTPIVPLRLFRSRSVSGANVVMLLVGAAFFSMWYFLSLYMQNVLGYGALRAGMAFLPMAVAIIVGAQTSPRLMPRAGASPLLLTGTLLAGAGFAWMSTIGPHSSYVVHVLGPGCLVSFALGLLFTPLAAAATSGVHYTEAGLASGVLNTSRQVGGSVGLAALATVAIDHTHSLLSSHHNTAAALTGGYGRAFVVAAGLSAVACVCALIVPRTNRRPAALQASVEASPARQAAPTPGAADA